MSIFLPAHTAARSSLEDPSVPISDPHNSIWDIFGATLSVSGMRVNEKTALKMSAYWRGVNLIGTDVGKLPLFVYKRTAEGKERDPTHPAYNACRHEANTEMSAMTLRKTGMGHTLTVGNQYQFILRQPGKPIQLIPLNPLTTFPVREGSKLWIVVQVNGKMVKEDPSNIIHIPGLGFDGLVGYSVVQFARESVGRGLAMQDYGARFFRNNARPTTVIQHPGMLGDKAQSNLRKSWNAMYQGLSNQHLTAILEEGMTLHTLSDNAKDSQLIQSEAHSIRDIANWVGVPPHKVGDTTRTAFSSLEEENRSYLTESLDGWLVAIEEEYRRKLLTEEEKRKESHFIEFKREALLRADLAARGEYYTKALGGAPWMLQDEVRSIETLNDFPDGKGKEVLIPLNIGEQGGSQTTPPEPAPEEDERTAAIVASNLRVMRDGIERISKRIASRAKRAAKKPDGFSDWIDKVCEDERQAFRDAVLAPCQAIGVARGVDGMTEYEWRENAYFEDVVRPAYLEAADAKPDGLEESTRIASDMLLEYRHT